MKKINLCITLLAALLTGACRQSRVPVLETGGDRPMPAAWIDRDTGHRVDRLTGPEGNNRSFYFHNNPFISGEPGKGDLMVFYGNVPDSTTDRMYTESGNRQLFALNLKTGESRQITHHPTRIFGEIVGKKGKDVYYQAGDSVFTTNILSLGTRLVYVFPDSIRGQVTTLNADETLLGGVASGPEKLELLRKYPRKHDYFNRIYAAKLPHSLFTVNVETGDYQRIFGDTAWLNHVQFSPTDPNLLMFCHEGPWHLVDRIWTLDIRNPEPRLMHARTVKGEIAGHEFFSPDGRTIWFDLQIPRSGNFYLAGVDVATGQETRYALTRNEWSVHFNISPDEKIFAGDGGDPGQVARAPDGMWLYLFTPAQDSLRSEKLVNMKHHDYSLEPNVHFTPDGKRVIFRANFEGSSQIYSVELK